MSDSPMCLWPQCNELFLSVEDLIQHVEEEHVMSDISAEHQLRYQRLAGVEANSTFNHMIPTDFGISSALSRPTSSSSSLPSCFTESFDTLGPSVMSASHGGYGGAKSVDSPISMFIHMSHVSPYFTDEERAIRRKQQEIHRRRSSVADSEDEDIVIENLDMVMDEDMQSRKRRKSSDTDSAFEMDLKYRPDSPSDSAIGSPINELPTPQPKKLNKFSREIIAASSAQIDPSEERPYRCPVPECDKRYKNLNGIKYHSQHGHTNLSPDKQVYQCLLMSESKKNILCGSVHLAAACIKEHVKREHPIFVERVGKERLPRPSISKITT
eukprot:CFRG2826T1